MSYPDPTILERAVSMVHVWEANHLTRMLTTAEEVSLIQAVAHRLERVTDAQARDFLEDAYALVDAWDARRKEPHLNAAEAATLAEYIAQALQKASVMSRSHPPD